jgi:hypothetical protein
MSSSNGGKRSRAKRPRAPKPLNPAALSIEELAALLTKAGSRTIPIEQVRRDQAAGAPTNADGTIHLVHYTAWLASVAD